MTADNETVDVDNVRLLELVGVVADADRIVMTCAVCEGRLTVYASPRVTLWTLVDPMLDHLRRNHAAPETEDA